MITHQIWLQPGILGELTSQVPGDIFGNPENGSACTMMFSAKLAEKSPGMAPSTGI